jgi:hypothetical protein
MSLYGDVVAKMKEHARVTITTGAVTYNKIQASTQDNIVLGRKNGDGIGPIEEIRISDLASTSLTTTTANYTVLNTDFRVEATVTNNITLTLPDPTNNTGQEYKFINHYSSTGDVLFSRTIDGITTPYISPGDSILIYSNGTEYLIG